ncbi:hypothetical protein [Vibrio marisflavi]|uniref:hypothetical protein n=1 Tax=Vibrio marisflavi TaxID=1216040 RepID=UPI001F3DAFAA|nr:hypothetical protein [Vibrio marisflavi]
MGTEPILIEKSYVATTKPEALKPEFTSSLARFDSRKVTIYTSWGKKHTHIAERVLSS